MPAQGNIGIYHIDPDRSFPHFSSLILPTQEKLKHPTDMKLLTKQQVCAESSPVYLCTMGFWIHGISGTYFRAVTTYKEENFPLALACFHRSLHQLLHVEILDCLPPASNILLLYQDSTKFRLISLPEQPALFYRHFHLIWDLTAPCSSWLALPVHLPGFFSCFAAVVCADWVLFHYKTVCFFCKRLTVSWVS